MPVDSSKPVRTWKSCAKAGRRVRWQHGFYTSTVKDRSEDIETAQALFTCAWPVLLNHLISFVSLTGVFVSLTIVGDLRLTRRDIFKALSS